MSALQTQEQGRSTRHDKVIEGVFYVKMQNSGRGKQQSSQKNKVKNDDEMNPFPPCKHCKRTTHMEKYSWWRLDVVCGDYKQLGHISKACKSKIKVSKQIQLVEASHAQEEQLFTVIVVAHTTCAKMLTCSKV